MNNLYHRLFMCRLLTRHFSYPVVVMKTVCIRWSLIGFLQSKMELFLLYGDDHFTRLLHAVSMKGATAAAAVTCELADAIDVVFTDFNSMQVNHQLGKEEEKSGGRPTCLPLRCPPALRTLCTAPLTLNRCTKPVNCPAYNRMLFSFTALPEPTATSSFIVRSS